MALNNDDSMQLIRVLLTFVSGSSSSMNRKEMKLKALYSSSVPDTLRGELERIGEIWLTQINPIQNPVLAIDTIRPRWKLVSKTWRGGGRYLPLPLSGNISLSTIQGMLL